MGLFQQPQGRVLTHFFAMRGLVAMHANGMKFIEYNLRGDFFESIVIEQIDEAMLIPNRAVRVVDGERVVYILKDGQLEPVQVTLGASSDLYSQVVGGDLSAGDTIVLNPPSMLLQGGPMGGGPPGGGGF